MQPAKIDDEPVPPEALRRALSLPASLGDLLEAWLLTHPSKAGRAASGRNGATDQSVRRAMSKDGASDSAVNFWMGGDN